MMLRSYITFFRGTRFREKIAQATSFEVAQWKAVHLLAVNSHTCLGMRDSQT